MRTPTRFPTWLPRTALTAVLGTLLAAPAAAQRVATGGMTVRVTVLDAVRPVTVADTVERPQLVRDPATGRYQLRLVLGAEGPVEAQVANAGGLVRPRVRPVEGDTTLHALRVELPAATAWTGDTLEVRVTARTGEAETTLIARIPADAAPRLPRTVGATRVVATTQQ